MRKSLRALLFVLCSLPAFSQEFRASVAGIVTDPAGASVGGAKVTVTNVARNSSAEDLTNADGRYIIQFLLPGQYTITVDKTGFKRFVREGVSLSSADRLSLDVRLDLGAVSDSVTVTGEAPVLQTETASRSALIENRALETVPTNGRNLYQLQYTLPGVIKNSTYWGSMELYAFGNINGVSISGGRSGENETLIDGISDTRPDRGVVYAPSLNGTQEFTIQTNNYDAQYGRVGGGVTSIVTKSGTNSLHGELFEFLKNDKLRANDWAANKAGLARVPFKQSTFGFEFDGPVYLPKIFDGRNRMFFMISLEGLREHNPGGQVTTLPTAEQLQGDFSGLRNSAGQLVTIYDPTTTALGADGKTYTRAPFAGNRIPANRINPIAAKVASFYPKPTGAGDGPDHQNNYAVITASTNSYDSWLGKLDYRISQKSSVFFRYGQTPWGNFSKIVWGTNAAEPSGEAPSTRVSRNWGADWTYTLSPSVVLNLRGGLARYEGFSGNIFARGFDPRQLGFPSSLASQFLALQFPRFNLGVYSPLGATTVTSYEAHDNYSLQPNASWMHGRHSSKYGAELRLYNRNQLQPGAASGTYNFGKNWTQGNPLQADALSGNEFASFLLGLPNGGNVVRNIDPSYQNKYYALFVQDDWKLTPNLTLNLGLRWDYETPRAERHNRMVRGFAFDQASPIATSVQGLNLKGGLLFAGSGGDARRAFAPDKNNFQPRIGVAWRLLPKWVLRGGYALTYLGQDAAGPATGFSQTTTLIPSTDGGITPAASLSDPFPTNLFPTGLLQPIGSSQGLATNLGQAVQAQFLDRPLPLSHQYSLGVQREFRGGWLADVSYVGNQTRKLPVAMGLNFLPTSALNAVPVDQRSAYFTTAVSNPMAGLLPNSSINGVTVPRQQLLFAYPQYTQVTISDVPVGSQRYDALQAKLARRFHTGLGVQLAYTWSKTLEKVTIPNAQSIELNNLVNTVPEKRLYQYDIPHKFAAVVSYELPFGKGKRFGNSMNRWLNGIIGNWNLNAQTVVQSGFIFDFPTAAPLAARSAKLTDDQRDALARDKGRKEFDVSVDKWFDTSLFPNRAPAPFTLRDFPTRFPDVRSRGLKSSELSVYKEFPIRERVRWQIRADFQNAFNYPLFGRLLSNNVTDSRFGQLTASMSNEQKLIVAVMKIVF
jgi:hypothetical protein